MIFEAEDLTWRPTVWEWGLQQANGKVGMLQGGNGQVDVSTDIWQVVA